MDEEKKYSIIGEVKIGTDEYRDLIEGLAKVKADLDKRNDAYWDMRSKLNKAEEQVKSLQNEFAQLNNFVNSSEELKAKYKAWRLERLMIEQENKDEQS